jgi:hypothetical protein
MSDNNLSASVVPENKNAKLPVKNTLVWILAFLPAIGVSFEFGTVALLVITIVLCYFDEKNIKKLGYDDMPLGGAWLVPVYLYNRAKYFNHGKGYFITWCVTFALSFFGFLDLF